MMNKGFTLAELLIALAILGMIATFTIPKVLQAQKNQAWKSEAKEAMAAVSQAYQTYIQKNGYNANMSPGDLIQYMNYVRLDSTTELDGPPTSGPWECSWNYCLLLHNGGMLYMNWNYVTFGQANPNNYIYMLYDPDGKVTGNADSIDFDLYYNGHIATVASQKAGDVCYSGGVGDTSTGPGTDPPWFSWN